MDDVTDTRTGVRTNRTSPIFDKDLNSSQNFFIEHLLGEYCKQSHLDYPIKGDVVCLSHKIFCDRRTGERLCLYYLVPHLSDATKPLDLILI
jgi:hypothetical protein